ncbi:MAG: ribonuclease HII [Acidilobaceae archaeon]|nr:ribonuclease HII [Acidilobaceae archaeon]MCX8165680.1 ribonuclease HII [Acidilobaceae archaeon]MDW7974105.1 ribonuclease HII [Sulfolobales archaeon]
MERKLFVGVDEAGRGSLVGELVVVAVAVPEERIEELRRIGVKDSKELTQKRRGELYEALKYLPFSAEPITPAEIDRHNINRLEERAILRALLSLYRRLGEKLLDSRIVVDKFGSPRRLEEELRGRGFRGELLITEGADENYVEVSAASIIAKHLRDARLRVLSSLYGVKGSGYPHDRETIEWLRRAIQAGERPPIVRYSWSTLASLGIEIVRKGKSSHKTLDEFM